MLRDRTKKILNKYGIRLSKGKGQSHLVDREVLERIVEYADVSERDEVLEIGPGIGNLTRFLLERAGKLNVVEKDNRLIEVLRDRFGESENLKIIRGDVLEVKLPDFEKVVANLPYSISSPVTFRIIERDFDLAVLMYQKEFAERMVASPGSSQYSRLSVGVSYHGEAEILEEVPPDKFLPPPQVNSAIVRFEPRSPSFKVDDEDLFFKVIRGTFGHRRKKLRNGLVYSFEEIFPGADGFSRARKRKVIDESVPEKFAERRPENITPEEFAIVSNSLNEARELID